MQKRVQPSTLKLNKNAEAGIARAQEYAKMHRGRFERELSDFLRIPSISAEPSHRSDMRRGADYVREMLVQAGLQNVKIEQGGKDITGSIRKNSGKSGREREKGQESPELGGHPIVTGEYRVGSERPTVLIYGHYDVQPVDPLALWETPPFEPVIKRKVKGRRIYARGASDDKGQLSIHIKALESMLRTGRTLPVNVKVLIEGEEEISSPSLLPYLKRHKKQLKSDLVLISDTEMAGAGQPAITSSLRGIMYLEVDIATGDRDVHSGVYGGAVLNAGEVLMRALSMLKNTQSGRLNIAGLYRDVKRISALEKREMRELSKKESALKKELGIKRFSYEKTNGGGRKKGGERLFFERTTAAPSLEISGFTAGYTGAGAKTIVPAKASAKIGVRLIVEQKPQHVGKCVKEQIRANLEKIVPGGLKNVSVRFKELGMGAPVCVERTSRYIQAGLGALQDVYGKEAVLLRSGGSIPIVADFVHVLGVEPILMGFGLKIDGLHSPNESFSLEDFHKGIATSIRYLHAI